MRTRFMNFLTPRFNSAEIFEDVRQKERGEAEILERQRKKIGFDVAFRNFQFAEFSIGDEVQKDQDEQNGDRKTEAHRRRQFGKKITAGEKQYDEKQDDDRREDPKTRKTVDEPCFFFRRKPAQSAFVNDAADGVSDGENRDAENGRVNKIHIETSRPFSLTFFAPFANLNGPAG